MVKKSTSKTMGANIVVPQSRDEATAALARIGVAQRKLIRAKADLDDRVAKLKEAAETAATPLAEEVERLTEGLKIWAEANRTALTGGDRTKTVNLGTGEIKWRIQPPRVSLRGSIEVIIDACRTLGLGRFVRVKEEVSREAMLAEAEIARTIPGVAIGTEGEAFVVEPFEIDLAAGEA